MRSMEINDTEMYDYFEKLLYGGKNKNGLKKAWKKEISPQEYGLTEKNIHSILGSKELLYGKEDAKRQICLLEGMQKFLHEYVGIEGLEELLVNNYGTIENSIFFEHDACGNPVNIREHAKHQMKNAFLGSVLLLEFDLLKNVSETVYQAKGSAARYLLSQAEQLYLEKNGKKAEIGSEDYRQKILDRLEGWSYKIFMVSSMLHDIGYPLEFYLRSAQTLADYPPYLKILSPTVKAEFAEIKALLLESQLFRQVDHKEIKEKYAVNNHGVLSAVSLLMHFYYGGKIYSMNTEDRCIIEMSAIAIYRHTDRFQNGFRMVYQEDPISYMVRLCDDLQEWNRFRLLINDKHNYLQCSNCGKILLEEEREYQCTGCDCKYEKITQINNRKVNYICLCDSLSIETVGGHIKITFSFDLMKQLEILLDDYTAVIKSRGDLGKVENLLKDQSMVPAIEIDYFLSNNPVCIIEKMIMNGSKSWDAADKRISEWLEKQGEGKKKDYLKAFYRDFLEKRGENPFGKEVENNVLCYETEVQDYVKKNYGEIYSIYNALKN